MHATTGARLIQAAVMDKLARKGVVDLHSVPEAVHGLDVMGAIAQKKVAVALDVGLTSGVATLGTGGNTLRRRSNQ